MFRINRSVVYATYAALTLGAFAANVQFKSAISIGVATNLLAGLVVIAFIDTLNRVAEENRRRPVLLATLRVDGVTCARLYSLISEIAQHAAHFCQDAGIVAEITPNDRLPRRLAELASQIPSQHALASGQTLLKTLFEGAISVKEYADKALERYGAYQDPDIFLAIARLEGSTLLSSVVHLYRYNQQTNTRFPPEMWTVLLEVHDTLRGYLDRMTSRVGYDPREPL